MSTIRDRLQTARRPLPTKEELMANRLDQFELVDTSRLNRFHLNQLEYGVERAEFSVKPLIAVVDNETVTLGQLPVEETIATYRNATYTRVAVEDERVFSNGSIPTDSYNEVEIEVGDHGLKCTCSCAWSREGREYGGRFYPYRACSHIMTAVAAYDPEVMKAYRSYKAEIQSQLEKKNRVKEHVGFKLTDM